MEYKLITMAYIFCVHTHTHTLVYISAENIAHIFHHSVPVSNKTNKKNTRNERQRYRQQHKPKSHILDTLFAYVAPNKKIELLSKRCLGRTYSSRNSSCIARSYHQIHSFSFSTRTIAANSRQACVSISIRFQVMRWIWKRWHSCTLLGYTVAGMSLVEIDTILFWRWIVDAQNHKHAIV